MINILSRLLLLFKNDCISHAASAAVLQQLTAWVGDAQQYGVGLTLISQTPSAATA